MPLDVTTQGPDVCFCDPHFIAAQWTAYWGKMVIVFDSIVIFNTANTYMSPDAKVFCTQILHPSMFLNN